MTEKLKKFGVGRIENIVGRGENAGYQHFLFFPQCLHAGGRERSTNEVQDRFLVVQARRHRFDNAATLRRDFQNATGVRISTQTIRNRLHDAGLRSRRPAIRVPLTRYHVQMRLAWARDHVTWTQNDWAPVLFTDESRFCVDFTDRRARVWRMPNERFAPVCVAEHNRFGGAQSWFGRE